MEDGRPLGHTLRGMTPRRGPGRPVGAIDSEPAGARPRGPLHELVPGTRIRQYELLRELGEGGMGVVFAARDVKLGRRVAIKFLRDATREIAERFLIEARATAQCTHENIVIIHEVGEHRGMPYMVLEFLEGQTLRDLLGGWDQPIALPPSRVVELILPVARALIRAHELGIVHRDLKPENVVVTQAGQVKVLDFGIAKTLGDAGARAPRELASQLTLTQEGALVGTLPYMAPEQMDPAGVDARSDVWAVGVMMFEMLLGRHPVEPLTADRLFENLVSPDPMPSAHEGRDVPAVLADIVDRCLRKQRTERIASAAELAGLLEPLLPGRHGRKLVEGESPYPGLTAFQEGDADRFFGRARDVSRAVTRIRELPLVGVVGASGAGKSSFVRAGIGPALKGSGERWEAITLRPGRAPLAALASVLQRSLLGATLPLTTGQTEHAELVRRIRAEPGFLGETLRQQAREAGGNILLFVDQLEELYTLVADAGERMAFTAALAGAADDTAAPLRVVVSMRSDLLDRAAEDARFMEDLSRGLIFLSPPDRDGLREALVQPIEMIGYRFETAAMVEDMLDALAGTPGALPLLQFTAAKLWEARDPSRRWISEATYRAIGGISGALASHADQVLETMNASARRLTEDVFRKLVTPERTRAIVELDDLHALATDRAEIVRVLDQLVGARLLVVQPRGGGGGGTVEIVHESLIDRWPTLRRWLDEDRDDAAFRAQLAAAAKQWEARGRTPGLLWRGEAVKEAARWSARRRSPLPPRDQAFLDAVLGLARRARRARRLGLVAAFVVLGAVAAGASIAYLRVRSAEQEAVTSAARARDELDRRKAEEAARKAEETARKTEETARRAAEEGKTSAERDAQAKGQEIAESREELQAKNKKLQAAAAEATAAQARAEKASIKAEQAAAEARQARSDLEKALAKERARVKQLEEQRKKLSTELKE